MKVTYVKEKTKADFTIVPFWEEGTFATGGSFPELKPLLESKDFKGKQGETALVYAANGEKILLLGLGKKEKVTGETLRRAYASSWKKIIEKKGKNALLVFPKVHGESEESVYGVIEGILLTNYAYDKWKKEKTVLPKELLILGLEKKWEKEVERIGVIAKGVHFIRDLVNGNADEINPSGIVKEALNLAKSKRIKTEILEKKQLEKEGMGLLLAVGQGATDEPRLIVCSYRGDPKSKETTVLIGKGITFDSGGLSLKPSDNMLTMKCDMAGAATVLAAIQVAAELDLKINITVLAPVAENAIGSRAYKLGDVFTSCSGKTVEILNTDAEGRLILADALAYAVKHLKPTRMVDMGTLTGAVVIALGEEISGFYANDEKLAQHIEKASKNTAEVAWRLPLYDYRDSLKSDIADISNMGGRDAGSMKCALFLEAFVDNVPWAHIDMAGPAYLSKPKHYTTTKGTGWGLRLLIDYLSSL